MKLLGSLVLLVLALNVTPESDRASWRSCCIACACGRPERARDPNHAVHPSAGQAGEIQGAL